MNRRYSPINGINGKTLNIVYLVSGCLLLIITWYVIALMVTAGTEGWLAPWDTQRFRPPLGTWERTVNDFFEGAPGSLLPALIVILMSLVFYMYGLSQSKNKEILTWKFAVTNLFFIILDALLVIWSRRLLYLWLPQPRPRINVGYHLTWPAILVTIVLVGILITTQAIFSFREKLTHQNQ